MSIRVRVPGVLVFLEIVVCSQVKLWNVGSATPSCISSKDLKIGKLYSMSFDPYSPNVLAAGGSKGTSAFCGVACLAAGKLKPQL